MSRTDKPSAAAMRSARHRERMRIQGLRRIEIWVPDVRSPEFAVEARRQSLLVATSEHAQDDQAFVDAVSEGA